MKKIPKDYPWAFTIKEVLSRKYKLIFYNTYWNQQYQDEPLWWIPLEKEMTVNKFQFRVAKLQGFKFSVLCAKVKTLIPKEIGSTAFEGVFLSWPLKNKLFSLSSFYECLFPYTGAFEKGAWRWHSSLLEKKRHFPVTDSTDEHTATMHLEKPPTAAGVWGTKLKRAQLKSTLVCPSVEQHLQSLFNMYFVKRTVRN